MPGKEIQIIPIVVHPIIKEGDDISNHLISAMKEMTIEFLKSDVVVISHSIVSIAEGSIYTLSKIIPTEKAKRIALGTDHTETHVEVALRESSEIIREEPVLITRTHQGLITDYSGVDESNAPEGKLIALPNDSDASARRINANLSSVAGFNIPVIITDTQGRPWRNGAVNLAIGVAGMSPFVKNKGREDIYGKTLQSSLVCVADEIAASAELVMGQADEKIPIAIVRGLLLDDTSGSANEILRNPEENLFR